MNYQFKNGKLAEYTDLAAWEENEDAKDWLSRQGYSAISNTEVANLSEEMTLETYQHCTDKMKYIAILTDVFECHYILIDGGFINLIEFLRYIQPVVSMLQSAYVMEIAGSLIKKLEDKGTIPRWYD